MEVHNHGHVHEQKKWKEYVFQFFMLFLAVFCGYLAEYQLEHKIETDREKQFVASLVYDLKDDVASLEEHTKSQRTVINMMDSLFTFINDPNLAAENGDAIYYIGRVGPRLPTFASNNKTFEQLKNSGGFRLIRKQEISNKIMSYYNKLPMLHQLENNYSIEFVEYKKLAAKIFDPAIFRKMENDSGGVNRGNDNPPLRTYDLELLKEFGINIVYLNGTRKGLLPTEETLKKSALELIDYLEKQYHLE
jgi:hypothetical protein